MPQSEALTLRKAIPFNETLRVLRGLPLIWVIMAGGWGCDDDEDNPIFITV